MNDLNEMLERAAEPDDLWSVHPEALLSHAKKRVRRRRAAGVTGGAAAAVALVAAAVAATGGPWETDAMPVADDPAESGSYEDVRLSVAEVERRCSDVLNLVHGDEGAWVLVAHDGEPETREGWETELAPASSDDPKADSWHCTVPQASMMAGLEEALALPLPPPDDEAAIIDYCSRVGAYDLAGWEVLSVVSDVHDLSVVLVSTNGQYANCSPSEIFAPKADASLAMIDPASLVADPNRDWCGCLRALGQEQGIIPGLPHAHTLEIRVEDTLVATTTTDQGAYAFTYADPAPRADRAPELHATVIDPAGDVVWEGAFDQLAAQGFEPGA